MSICDDCSDKETCSPEKAEACDAIARAMEWYTQDENSPSKGQLKDRLRAVTFAYTANSAIVEQDELDDVSLLSFTTLAMAIGYYLGKFGFIGIDELKRKYPRIFV